MFDKLPGRYVCTCSVRTEYCMSEYTYNLFRYVHVPIRHRWRNVSSIKAMKKRYIIATILCITRAYTRILRHVARCSLDEQSDTVLHRGLKMSVPLHWVECGDKHCVP